MQLLTPHASRLTPDPRQCPIQRVRELLLLARAVGRIAAGVDAGAAEADHEVAHGEAFADALGGELLPARVEDDDAARHEERGEGDVSGDPDIARHRPLRYVPIG